ERAKLAETDVALFREVRDPDLHRQPGSVRDELLSVAVQDRPPRRLDPDVTKLVVLRRAQKLLAVEDLQRPEPEEQRREDSDRERPHQTDSQCELRRQPVRLLRAWVGREEPPGVDPLSQAGAPPV